MKKHGQLKLIHLISLLCFAVAIACLVSIFTQLRSLDKALAETRDRLSANPENTRRVSLEKEFRELKQRHKRLNEAKAEFEEDLAACRKTLDAQKEDLKDAAEQIRRLSSPE